jgi:hypothetical protein
MPGAKTTVRRVSVLSPSVLLAGAGYRRGRVPVRPARRRQDPCEWLTGQWPDEGPVARDARRAPLRRQPLAGHSKPKRTASWEHSRARSTTATRRSPRLRLSPSNGNLLALHSQRVVITGSGWGAYGGHQDRWQMLVLAGCNAVPRLDGSPYAEVPAHRGTRSTSGGACEPLSGRWAWSEIWVGVPGGAAGWLSAWCGANLYGAGPSLWLRAVCWSRSPAAAEAAGRDCPRGAGPSRC